MGAFQGTTPRSVRRPRGIAIERLQMEDQTAVLALTIEELKSASVAQPDCDNLAILISEVGGNGSRSDVSLAGFVSSEVVTWI
jgi:hypothetical protein